MAILLAEPDPVEALRLAEGLAAAGYETHQIPTGPGLLAAAPDHVAVISEVALPGFTGLEAVQRLRESGVSTPFLFLSGLNDPLQRVRGLEAGADDYLGKPYAMAELVARVRSLIRRSGMPARTWRIEVGDLAWEPATRRVTRCGQRLDLTPMEYALLALLLEQKGQVVTREQMAVALWGRATGTAENRSPNALDAQVRRLRVKVDAPGQRPLLHTLRGQGMVLELR